MSVDRSTVEYWNARVAEYVAKGDFDDMVWNDSKRTAFWSHVRDVLSCYRDCTVLDVASGHGQFCELFDPLKYMGIDFSPAMIDLARQRHPGYEFHCVKFEQRTESSVWREFDFVFAACALGSMRMSAERFRDLAMPWCKLGVMSLEDDEVKFWRKET